jgi:hypothetical protein
MVSMLPVGQTITQSEYQKRAWDDFLTHQMASFGTFSIFLGRGNHEDVPPMTRAGAKTHICGYIQGTVQPNGSIQFSL